MKIAFIGGGNMAGAMIQGLLNDQGSTHEISVIEPFEGTRQSLQSTHARHQSRFKVFPDVATAQAAGALQVDVIILAVKPQVMPEVARSLAPAITQQLVLSVAAGIRLQDLSRWLGGHQRLIRAMPNTPALISMGIAGVSAYAGVDASAKAQAEALLRSVGEVVWIDDEAQIDAVTALSGSGPAYVFLVIEAMQAAGEKLGLSPAQAAMLAKHTVRGAAELAQRAIEPPSVLRERVTSKGGTTAAALAIMNSHGLKEIFEEALEAARTRGAQMGAEFGAL